MKIATTRAQLGQIEKSLNVALRTVGSIKSSAGKAKTAAAKTAAKRTGKKKEAAA